MMFRHRVYVLLAVMRCCFPYIGATTVRQPDSTTYAYTATAEETIQTTTKPSDFVESQTETEDDNTSFTDYYEFRENRTLTKAFFAMDISKFHVNCTEDVENADYDEYYEDMIYEERHQELTTMANEVRYDFQEAIRSVMIFVCADNSSIVNDTINSLQDYVQKCTKFIGELKSTDEDITNGTILDLKPYEDSIKYVTSIICIVQQFKDLVDDTDKMVFLRNSFVNKYNVFDHFNKTKVWETFYKEQTSLLNIMEKYIVKIGNLSEEIELGNLSNIMITQETSDLVDLRYWENEVSEQRKLVEIIQCAFYDFKKTDTFQLLVKPIVSGTVSSFSVIGNTLLLLIFIRHKEMRTLANLMLINLAVIDCFAILFGVILDNIRLLYRWQLGVKACKLFFFIQYMSIGVSTYSVVMLSVQRFLAVRDVPGSRKNLLQNKTKAIMMLSIVWLVGCITAVPHAIAGDVILDLCLEVRYHSFGTITTIDLCTFCVIPIVLLATFSAPTALYIKRSVQKMPGEGTPRMKQMKHDRVVTSKVLFTLVILYFIAYLPYFLLMFLTRELGITFSGFTLSSLNTFSFCLRSLNCCLNPVALYIMSKCYRKYFNMYIPCCK
ncbi:uncharacterized protein [Periplaneta americana]|uniref:uncharacterized protein n=1 Tax=Periplaneta americana TaxID=6978 RepID=UPI0037E84F41